VDNEAGELLPGGFARVRFEASSEPGSAPGAEPQNIGVPPSALIFGKDGVRVATLLGDDRVLLKQVTIGRDLGKVVELASGLEPGDRLIDSPPDGIVSGERVRIAAAPESVAP
jgi:multidrug efflux pump subunit AcrA (membrane-fusion protein)